ncbi:hypothetical protein, partial [Roseburia sp. AF25-25LB]|uniref:hypothetical protein n=1 Tax=Roseburia sp. AF25-25LB TaxID=2293135 RepID=UPI000FF2CE54
IKKYTKNLILKPYKQIMAFYKKIHKESNTKAIQTNNGFLRKNHILTKKCNLSPTSLPIPQL